MVDSPRMVSGELGGKLIRIPTQWYDVMYGKFGKIFVGTFYEKLDGVRAWKRISERVVVLQSVILQFSQCVNNSKYICARILFQLKCCNCGNFDELMKDTFCAATGYLGKVCGIQTDELRRCTF